MIEDGGWIDRLMDRWTDGGGRWIDGGWMLASLALGTFLPNSLRCALIHRWQQESLQTPNLSGAVHPTSPYRPNLGLFTLILGRPISGQNCVKTRSISGSQVKVTC